MHIIIQIIKGGKERNQAKVSTVHKNKRVIPNKKVKGPVY